MVKYALGGMVALALLTNQAAAQTRMDCGSTYKASWEQLRGEKYRSASAERLANVSRLLLRAYDACQAGDEQDAKQLFDRVALAIVDLGSEGTGPYNPTQPSR